MAFCKQCGAKLNDDSKFCPSCGAPVEEAQSAPRAEVQSNQPDCNKWFGVLAYLGPVLFVPMFVKKDSKFAQYHVRQGFNLLVFWVAAAVLQFTIGFIPYFGEYFIRILCGVAEVGICVLSVIGIVHALKGEMKPLPWFGDKLDLLHMLTKQ